MIVIVSENIIKTCSIGQNLKFIFAFFVIYFFFKNKTQKDAHKITKSKRNVSKNEQQRV